MLRLAVLLSATLVAPGLIPPAFAQSALNGDWNGLFHEDQPERGPGPALGDYLGIPVNEAGRQYADSWDASRLTLPEHQCRAHVSPYIYRGPIRVKITEEIDPSTQNVIAIRHFLSTYAQERMIWLDGRPHPPEDAPHTWMGFSTGRWEGRVLRVETTHIKQGWHRRNGIPMSAQTKMTEYFFRHGNVLTQLSHHRGPDLPVRAAGQDHQPAAGRQQPAQSVPGVAVLPGRRRSAGTRPCVRAAPSGRQEPVPDRVRRAARAAGGAHARWRRDDVSGVRGEGEDDADRARRKGSR